MADIFEYKTDPKVLQRLTAIETIVITVKDALEELKNELKIEIKTTIKDMAQDFSNRWNLTQMNQRELQKEIPRMIDERINACQEFRDVKGAKDEITKEYAEELEKKNKHKNIIIVILSTIIGFFTTGGGIALVLQLLGVLK